MRLFDSTFRAFAALVLALAATLSVAHAAPADDTIRTSSGLAVVVTAHGKGAQPAAGQVVIVHYTGTLTDGTVFDDSRKRNEPFAFTLGKGEVIKGWDEGIALLHIGDKARLLIPSNLAYGPKGAGNGLIPPDANLTFDVELLDIKTKTVGSQISATITAKGVPAARKEFAQLKRKKFAGYYLSESDINAAGYRFLQAGKTAEAIALFTMNVELFPKSGNVYDSLGEGCMTAGDRERAIWNYEKSLALDPGNKNAEEMLKKLKGG